MKARRGWRLRCWLTVCGLVLCAPTAAQQPAYSCFDPEPREAPPGAKPPPTHPDFQKGLEAFERKCWLDVAICMCRAEESWPEDGELARFYDRWFPHYLPRYYLGLALYHLGCYQAARVQFGKSVLSQDQQYADRAREEARLLDRLSEDLEGLADRADCPLWRTDEPPECAPMPGRCRIDPGGGSP